MSLPDSPDRARIIQSVERPNSSIERPERPRTPKPTKLNILKPEITKRLEQTTQWRSDPPIADDRNPLPSGNSSSSYPVTVEVVPDNVSAHNDTPVTPKGKNILYNITCFDVTARNKYAIIDRYSTTPFEGFPVRKRQSQQKEHVGTDDVADSAMPFRGGLDFRVTKRGKRRIRIWSQEVIRVLRHETKYHPHNQIADRYAQSATSPEPFPVWMWHWERMWQICNDDHKPSGKDDPSSSPSTVDTRYNKVTREHLEIVLTSLLIFYDKEIAPELRLHEEKQKLTWRELWLLYKPGSMVVRTQKGFNQFYVVCSSYYSEKSGNIFTVLTWNLVFDGRRLRRQCIIHDLVEFSGEREIQTLSLKPLKHLKDSAEEKQKAILRGRKYYKIICEAPTHFEYRGNIGCDDRVQYAGPVFIDPSMNSEKPRPRLGSVQGGDHLNMFLGPEPDDDGGGELFSAYNDIKVSKDGGPEDSDMYSLMPAHIAGFAPRKKQWTVFEIEGFKNKDQGVDANALDFVVMGPDHRLLLKGLVASHQVLGMDSLFTDLSDWLDLAQKWNAVVLIDEADMYLGKRQKKKELSRNAMVAAFLRALGTAATNRPGDLDDAFVSRFHLILQYQKLNDEKRGDIWRKFFAKLEHDQRTRKEEDTRIIFENHVQVYITTDTHVQSLEMNGRDIRNAFHAFIQMAVNRTFTLGQPVKNVRVTEQDVRSVIQDEYTFKKYIEDVHMGKTEEQRAFDDEIRPIET
ncbi:MAG: hypothetical protein Q9160_008013 [Pyrenula sp. 1 TL-2023]